MIKSKLVFIFVFIFVFQLFFMGQNSLATQEDLLGVEVVDQDIVLEDRDPREMAVMIINIFLGLLSIIAVSLIIYAGFIWMTSAGNEEKVIKAKNVLKSAIIGLIIILASWGIVSFIFSQFFPDRDPAAQDWPNNNTGNFQRGIGAIGACSVESVFPAPGQKNVARNSMILITFKEEVNIESIRPLYNSFLCLEENFSFEANTCSEPIDFTFETNDNKLFVISPKNLLGNDVSNSSYIAYFSNNVLRANEDVSIFEACSPQYLLWNFDVSNQLDLSPPKITSIFPQADNARDIISVVSPLTFSTARIDVVGLPNYFQAAQVVSVTRGVGTPVNASATINSNYSGAFTNFSVVIVADNRAQLMAGSENLGVFDVINGRVEFPNYFTFEIKDSFSNGNYWDIVVSGRVLADRMFLGSYEYTFVNGETNGYNISVENTFAGQADQISMAINNNPSVRSSVSGSSLNLSSVVGGAQGNLIRLESSSNNIRTSPFSGGVNRVENNNIQDKKDKPMNSVIQINFNEVINPLTLSGTSEELRNYIRVINLSNQNNIIDGRFVVSSDYRTVEFVSNYKCGTNACGEDIFCLPANSNIRVEIMAAELFNCENNNINCANKSPFLNCVNNVCQDANQNKYSLARIPFTGVTDSAGNSLDGNRDNYSDGPVSYFNQNSPENTGLGDNFTWSFWISDRIDSEPPKILEFSPTTPASLLGPIEFVFNKLLFADSIRTGSSVVERGDGTKVFHSRVNLMGGQMVGYWLTTQNEDVNPVDGDPDRTRIYINHAQLFEGADYRTQAGSGIRDIYQNCFKPSASINCNATPSNPSCCDLVPMAGSRCN